MAERTAILIDSEGDPLGTAENPLYIGGAVAVGSLGDLSDVVIASPASGEFLGYSVDLGKFTNLVITGSGLGDVTGPSGAVAGNFPVFDATGKILSDSGVNPASIPDVQVNSDWNAVDGASLILNKPTIPAEYVLPVASADVLGGVKVGSNIDIDENGVISVSSNASQVNSDWNAETGVASILNKPTIPSEYTLPAATADTLGGIKVGSNLSIDGDGVLSAASGTILDAPDDGYQYARKNLAWDVVASPLIELNSDHQIIPASFEGEVDTEQLCEEESGGHPFDHTWPSIYVYCASGAEVILAGAGGSSFTLDDAIDLVTPLGTFTLNTGGGVATPQDVSAYFQEGENLVHLRSYSTSPSAYYVPDLFLFINPRVSRDFVPRYANSGKIGSSSFPWGEGNFKVVVASEIYRQGHLLMYSDVASAASEDHTHDVASTDSAGFLATLNGDPASYMGGDGAWHGTGGMTDTYQVKCDVDDGSSDYIGNKLSGGDAITISLVNFGGFHTLSIDADIAASDAIGVVKGGANVYINGDGQLWVSSQVNSDWNAAAGVSSILNKPTIPEEYVLPTATADILGGVKVGSGITITDGVISVSSSSEQVNSDWNAETGVASILNKPTIPSEYTLPAATADTLGGIKVGSNLQITDGVLSATPGTAGSSHVVQWGVETVVASDVTFLPWVAIASGNISAGLMSLLTVPASSANYCKVQLMKNGVLETDSILTDDTPMSLSGADSATNGVYQEWASLDSGRVSVASGDTLWCRINQADTGCVGLRVQVKINFA